MIRVLIADDEALMRAGIRLILASADDVEVVAEATDGHRAAALCAEHVVDVALLDVRMPGGDGIGAITQIARRAPRTRVLMLTTFNDPVTVTAALVAGAEGFLLKDTGPDDLLRAVRAVARGEPVLAPDIVRDLVAEHVARTRRSADDAGRAADARARRRLERLSAVELRVLHVLSGGAPNDEIARALYMSTGAVKAHISRILGKLECDNRVQAAVLAREARLDPDGP